MLSIDHVVVAVSDLDAAATTLLSSHGLASYPGGRHPDAGTANRIVPLRGGAYLELLTVVDPVVASSSLLGTAVTRGLAGGRHLLGWAVSTADLAAEAGRLGLETLRMSRARDDGSVIGWRLAGLERSTVDPSLPFLIAWDRPDLHPSAVEVVHPAGGVSLEELLVAGDAAVLAAWLGPSAASLPVRVVAPGPDGAGLLSLTLRSDRGQIALGHAGALPL